MSLTKQPNVITGRIVDHCKASDLNNHKSFNKFASGTKHMVKRAEEEREEREEKETVKKEDIHSDKKDEFEKITEVDPEFVYVRVRAVTANVPNNNGDLFEREELLRTYQTFINQRVFKNHKSDDVTNAQGKIIDAIWVENPEDQDHPYVECLLEIDRKKDPDLVRGVEKGYITDVSMGAVISGTPVMLADYSIKNIEEMDIQKDEIRTHTGSISGIRNMQIVPFSGNIYKVKVMGIHNELGITHEHPVYIIPKEELDCEKPWNDRAKCFPNNKSINKSCQTIGCAVEEEKTYVMEFVQSEYLRVGDYISLPFPTEEIEQDYLTEDFAKLFGYYVAEGWVRIGSCNMIQFCLDASNIYEISEVKSLIKNLRPNIAINEDYFLDRNGCYITIYDKELRDLFLKLGGKYSKKKVLDASVLLWNKDMQKAFIGKYIDGDGCVSNRDGMVYISTSSENLANQIQIILCRLGIVSNIDKIDHITSESSVVETGLKTIEYQISVGSYYVWQLKDFSVKAYNNIDITKELKKSDRKFIYKNYLMSPITGIRLEHFEGFAYNIESVIDESFVANRIVVHNCRVEYSVCSCCGNKAHTEENYCDCVKKYKGQKFCPVHKKSLKPNGIYESNFGVEFFELSFVTDGADRDAVIKEIVASSAMFGDIPEKLSKVGQILVDSPNVIFQDCGICLKRIASLDVISTKDMEIAENVMNLIESFID